MRVFLTRAFARFARKQRLKDEQLCEAIARAEKGLIDADLGNGLIKQRVAKSGRGRSGGYRTLIAYRGAQRSFFLLGFAKNKRDNIDESELEALKKLAKFMLEYTDKQIGVAVAYGELTEVSFEEEDQRGQVP